MRVSFLALGAALISTGVVAQARPSTPHMLCAQAAGIVASRGGVVLGTGGFTYDRFVTDRRFLRDHSDDRAGRGCPTSTAGRCSN